MVEVVSKAEKYLEASVRQNTSKSYAAALAHFEVTWEVFADDDRVGRPVHRGVR